MSPNARFALIAAGAVTLTASAASAAPVTDGTLDAAYGPARAVQQVATGFGDNTNPAVDAANGSELNNAYAAIDGGNLHLFLGGNVNNFNKLAIFIDNGSGAGQNVLGTSTGLPGAYGGFTFDAGFNATHFISLTAGSDAGGAIFVDYANLLAGTGGYAGTTGFASSGTLTDGSAGVGGALRATLNNSNIAGVTADAATGAAAVTTGAELALSLPELGNPTGTLKVSVFVNGQNHDYLSNQVLGSLPVGTANLGGDGTGAFTGNVGGINFAQIAGDQFFTVAVPEPTAALGLLGLGGLLLGRRRC